MNGWQLAEAARVDRLDLQVLFVNGYAEKVLLNHGHLAHGYCDQIIPSEAFARRVKDLITRR